MLYAVAIRVDANVRHWLDDDVSTDGDTEVLWCRDMWGLERVYVGDDIAVLIGTDLEQLQIFFDEMEWEQYKLGDIVTVLDDKETK